MGPTETLVCYGGEIKALDDAGRVGGYLVRYGSASQPDSSSYKDFFTPETDFWCELPGKTVAIYHHGLDATLGLQKLGPVELKADEVGVWAEAQLKLRSDYERKILEMARAGKLGWSSGSASHLVRREKQSNGSHKILSWPIAEASLTPAPAEPRAQVMALKSLLDDPDSGESFVAACLKSASDLGEAARRFAKVGTSKREAIKALRDALDGLLVASEPRPDPAEVARSYSRFLTTEARLRGVI